MANLDEIKDAVSVAKQYGSGEICVLHCISGYPTPPEQSNLLTINKLQTELDVPIGLSDHTLGNTTAIAATALGACVIEKHFTLCRDDGGPDAAFSLEPTELAELCRDVKSAWQSLGEGGFEHKEVEKDNVKFRRSLYACKNIKKGELITQENIKSVRPGFGLPPKDYDSILGKVAKKDIPFATPLSWPLLE